MHLALTDRIFCPECGPEYGLILLAHDVRDRRVEEGDLGCPGCERRYPIRDGFADLRPPPRDPLPEAPPRAKGGAADHDEIIRLGALLGVTEGPGTLLLQGSAAKHAGALAELIGGVEVVTLESTILNDHENQGVSRMAASKQLPFFSATFRGVLLSGASTARPLEEAARVLAPKSRLVILRPSSVTREELTALGLTVLLDDDAALVSEKERAGSLPLLTLRGP